MTIHTVAVSFNAQSQNYECILAVLILLSVFISDGPPTYQSLFAVKEIQEAKESSSNKGMFAAKVFEILCGSSKYGYLFGGFVLGLYTT